jgi:hypothetical protein
MESHTLSNLNKTVFLLKLEVARLRRLIEEKDLEVVDDISLAVASSRSKKSREFVSHESMRKEFDD